MSAKGNDQYPDAFGPWQPGPRMPEETSVDLEGLRLQALEALRVAQQEAECDDGDRVLFDGSQRRSLAPVLFANLEFLLFTSRPFSCAAFQSRRCSRGRRRWSGAPICTGIRCGRAAENLIHIYMFVLTSFLGL